MRQKRNQGRRALRNSAGPVVMEIQNLEARTLPAGTVTVAVSGGSVTITGDENDNTIDIDITTDGIFVTGRDGTKVKSGAALVLADERLAIVGSTELITGDLKIKMKGGDDDVEIEIGADEEGAPTEAQIDKNLTIEMGNGDDVLEVSINDVDDSLTVKKNTKITTGEGLDMVTLTASGEVVFEKNLDIDTGDEEDEVELDVSAPLTVIENATIKTGADRDVVSISNENDEVDFRKGLSISTGTGADEVSILNFFETGGTYKFGVDLKIETGSGTDQVILANCEFEITRNLIITTGSGSDSVNLDEGFSGEVGGDLKINTENGSDTVFVGLEDGPLDVTGNVEINTGSGSDTAALLADAEVTIGKNLKINTGSNTDQVGVLAGGEGSIAITGAFEVKLEGDDDCLTAGIFSVIQEALVGEAEDPSAATFEVIGDVKIGGGGGDDVISLGAIDTDGNLVIESGEGDDVVHATSLEIAKELKILTGAGADNVSASDIGVTGKTTLDTGANNDNLVIAGVAVANNVLLKMGAGDDNASVTGVALGGDGDAIVAVLDGGAHTVGDNLATDETVNEDADINFEDFDFVPDDVENAVVNAVLACFPFFELEEEPE